MTNAPTVMFGHVTETTPTATARSPRHSREDDRDENMKVPSKDESNYRVRRSSTLTTSGTKRLRWLRRIPTMSKRCGCGVIHSAWNHDDGVRCGDICPTAHGAVP